MDASSYTLGDQAYFRWFKRLEELSVNVYELNEDNEILFLTKDWSVYSLNKGKRKRFYIENASSTPATIVF